MRMKLDGLDLGILKLLQDNARISYAKIARKLGVSESTIRFRVKRLLDRGIITRFIALVNPAKIGLSLTSLLMIRIDPEKLDKVFDDISSFEEIHYILKCTGEYDAVAIFHARDMDHFNSIVNRVKRVDGVRDSLVWIATGFVKIEPRLSV
jgi:Lrp/AsnC family transcriptional regulator for asnA, asnC and gidA